MFFFVCNANVQSNEKKKKNVDHTSQRLNKFAVKRGLEKIRDCLWGETNFLWEWVNIISSNERVILFQPVYDCFMCWLLIVLVPLWVDFFLAEPILVSWGLKKFKNCIFLASTYYTYIISIWLRFVCWIFYRYHCVIFLE